MCRCGGVGGVCVCRSGGEEQGGVCGGGGGGGGCFDIPASLP